MDNSPDDGEGGSGELLPNKGQEEVDEKTKAGFQRVIATKDRSIKELGKELADAKAKVDAAEKAERERQLAEMSEAEKWKTIAQENAAKAAQSELKAFVTRELTVRKLITHAIAEIVIEAPWSVPAVKKHLSGQPTWEETVEAVKLYLPAYLDSLVVPTGNNGQEPPTPPTEEVLPPMDTERNTPGGSPSRVKRVWTAAEVSALSEDDYMKHQAEITQAIAEGRFVR